MAILSAVLPAAEGVAVYAALRRGVALRRGEDDGRSRSQIIADALVQRVLGRRGTAGTQASPSAVEVQLIMTDRALLSRDAEPDDLVGYGPVPAALARDLVGNAVDAGSGVFVRRLYTDECGVLASADSRHRSFPPRLARFIRTRDGRCRTPWCDAPIRHIDHVRPHAAGGPTSVANGQGLCERCNYAKQVHGWCSEPRSDGPVVIRTPTGHAYASRPAPLPGAA